MNLLHLITLPLLVVSFSGRPLPEKIYPVRPVKNVIADKDKKETAEEIPWVS